MGSVGSVPRPRVVLHGRTRKKLGRKCGKAKDARLRTRYLIVLRAADGWAGPRIAGALGCGEATVSRVLARWEAWGEAGLVDRREDNGQPKADERYASWVRWLLRFTPRAFLHRRPTWTKALLIETASWYTGKRVSLTTMGRLLRKLKARRGRAKAVAPCPWPEARKRRRLLEVAALVAALPADEACVWQDECDIHLNPKIGYDWMLPGTQRRVMTPGSNEKRYVAGAMDAATDRVVWVESDKKNSLLFIDLLKKLLREYPDKKVIHVILDNYGIHGSRQTGAWLAGRARAEVPAPLPAPVLPRRQPHRAVRLARPAPERHRQPPAPVDREPDGRRRPLPVPAQLPGRLPLQSTGRI